MRTEVTGLTSQESGEVADVPDPQQELSVATTGIAFPALGSQHT